MPNEEHVDATVRDILEETGLTMAVNDLTQLSGAVVRVPLHYGKYQLVYVYFVSVLVPYVNITLSKPTHVKHYVISHSTVQADGSYVVPATIAMDGLPITPVVTSNVRTARVKYELLLFGFVAQRQHFRDPVLSRQIFLHRDNSLPREAFFQPRFITVDSRHVKMLIRGYVNQLCDETRMDLRMGVLLPLIFFLVNIYFNRDSM
jgi:hypothetical protein